MELRPSRQIVTLISLKYTYRQYRRNWFFVRCQEAVFTFRSLAPGYSSGINTHEAANNDSARPLTP